MAALECKGITCGSTLLFLSHEACAEGTTMKAIAKSIPASSPGCTGQEHNTGSKA